MLERGTWGHLPPYIGECLVLCSFCLALPCSPRGVLLARSGLDGDEDERATHGSIWW